jgi:hypothetical protein
MERDKGGWIARIALSDILSSMRPRQRIVFPAPAMT